MQEQQCKLRFGFLNVLLLVFEELAFVRQGAAEPQVLTPAPHKTNHAKKRGSEHYFCFLELLELPVAESLTNIE